MVSPSCRADRILLFRGEPKRYTTPGISGLLRTYWSDGQYAKGKNASELLEQLRKDVQLLRPIYHGPTDGDPEIILERKGDGGLEDHWVFAPDSNSDPRIPLDILTPELPPTEENIKAMSLMQILFAYHVNSSYMSYRDPQKGVVLIDPFSSFSLDPALAIGFAKEDGHLIVASVPKSEIWHNCNETIPVPGQVWDPSGCVDGCYPEERELDAILYLSADYVWKSFYLKDPDGLN